MYSTQSARHLTIGTVILNSQYVQPYAIHSYLPPAIAFVRLISCFCIIYSAIICFLITCTHFQNVSNKFNWALFALVARFVSLFDSHVIKERSQQVAGQRIQSRDQEYSTFTYKSHMLANTAFGSCAKDIVSTQCALPCNTVYCSVVLTR